MRWPLARWEELPDDLRVPEVRPYWEALDAKLPQLAAKRVFDLAAGTALLVTLSPAMLAIGAAVTLDSPGGPFFRQERVTQYGRRFRIHKFRTMVAGADRMGAHVTSEGDARITRMGELLRRFRLDELPQLIDILAGDMSFVGTRPEVPEYVDIYEPEWRATLLLPAGVTSEASIAFKDEDALMAGAEDKNLAYITRVLPEKMQLNLGSIKSFSFCSDIRTMLRTVAAVVQRDSDDEEPADAPTYLQYVGEGQVIPEEPTFGEGTEHAWAT